MLGAKLNNFMDVAKPGSLIKVGLRFPSDGDRMDLESARKFLQKLLTGIPEQGMPGIIPANLDKMKNTLQNEIDITVNNNQMLIKAIEEYQSDATRTT